MFTEISLFSSYLKTAIRNLARHRIYSAINIIGIAIGLAFCILTYLFTYNEWTYDTFHKNADRNYRIHQRTVGKIAPNHAFNFSFIDEDLDKQYKKEERWNQMIQYATGFAIFIAALGAFGLAALATTRRTKEIGIRKVLGASQAQILSLLSREFILYIALSSLIAFPIAYYATNQWLQTFAYRAGLDIGAFLLGSLAMFLVVFTTVTAQTLKAARANPVEALRDE